MSPQALIRATGGGAAVAPIGQMYMLCIAKIDVRATYPLKTNNDEAIEECPTVGKVSVVKRGDGEVAMKTGRDGWWPDEMAAADIKN